MTSELSSSIILKFSSVTGRLHGAVSISVWYRELVVPHIAST